MKITVMYPCCIRYSLITSEWRDFQSSKNHESNKEMVTLAMDLALVKLGGMAFDEVRNRLHTKYQCVVTDCYEHPEYLKDVLVEIFGDASKVITESIRDDLKGISYDPGIEQFLKVLG